MAKIGEGMIGEMASLGLQELQAANSGQMAMGEPPIQAAEPAMDAPVVEQPSYESMLNQAASRGGGQEQDLSMER